MTQVALRSETHSVPNQGTNFQYPAGIQVGDLLVGYQWGLNPGYLGGPGAAKWNTLYNLDDPVSGYNMDVYWRIYDGVQDITTVGNAVHIGTLAFAKAPDGRSPQIAGSSNYINSNTGGLIHYHSTISGTAGLDTLFAHIVGFKEAGSLDVFPGHTKWFTNNFGDSMQEVQYKAQTANGALAGESAGMSQSGGQRANMTTSLAIQYPNTVPNAPTNISPANGAFTGTSGSIGVSAVVSDPDGDNVRGDWYWSSNGGGTWNGPYVGTTVGSGGTSTATLTGVPANTLITLHTRTYDSVGASTGPVATTFTTNRPPAVPAVTAPNGGEVWNTVHTITWTGGTDPDGQVTTIDVELTTDGGSNWTRILTATPNDGTQSYDFTSVAASTACRIRVRSIDSLGLASAWDESNANFTIQHNTAPQAPTLQQPANASVADLAAGFTLQYVYNDSAGETQASYALRRKISGAGTYEYWNATTAAFQATEVFNTLTVAQGAVASVAFAAAKWTNGNTYNWSVASRDNGGLTGPYASDFTVIASAGASVTVTTPTTPVTNTSRPVVTWSLSDPENDPQQTYRVVLFTAAQAAAGGFDPATSANTWDSTEVTNAATRNLQIPMDLTNGTTYRAYVRVKTNNQYSAWAYLQFVMSLTPPSAPTLVVQDDPAFARIILTVTGTHNTTSFPVATYNIEYSDDGGASWESVRNAGAIAADATGTGGVKVAYDYTSASGVERLYRASTVAEV